jgi:hypothetical protein
VNARALLAVRQVLQCGEEPGRVAQQVIGLAAVGRGGGAGQQLLDVDL